MRHILVIDTDPVNTKLLKFLLADEGFAVTAVHALDAALATLGSQVYDLIVLDTLMPGLDGVELCRRIRHTGVTPIMIVSARGEVSDKVAGLKAGADDYLPKPFDPSELLARAWALLRRGDEFAASASRIVTSDLVLDCLDNVVTLLRNGQTVRLMPTESRLLRCLVSNPGRTLARDTLVIKVWGYEYEAESNQLDVYIKRLRGKIEQNPRQPELLLTIRSVGYRFQPGEPRRRGATGASVFPRTGSGCTTVGGAVREEYTFRPSDQSSARICVAED